MVWVVDENQLFAVNQNLDIKLKKVGEDIVIVIDNFYQDPDAVRHLVMNSPSTTWDRIVTNSPGPRNLLGLNTAILREVTSEITKKFYQTQVFDINFFSSNLFRQTGKPAGISGIPHTDPYCFSGLVYLNTPDECHGGTAFYKNKVANSQYKTIVPDESLKNYQNFLTESNENWEVLDVIEMKYNRYLLYRSHMFHSPYIKREWFSDYYRINQIFFFNKILNNSSLLKLTRFPMIEEKYIDGELITMVNTSANTGTAFKDLDSAILNHFLNLIDSQKTFAEIFNNLQQQYPLNKKNIETLNEIIMKLFLSGILVSYNP